MFTAPTDDFITDPVQHPFFMYDQYGDLLLVLAAVFDVRPIAADVPDSPIRCQTRFMAEAYAQRMTDAGRPSKVVPVPINAIDVTVAVDTDFGDGPAPWQQDAYARSWCCQGDQSLLPRRQETGR